MTRYEYQVIPAPKRGDKQTGAKTAEDRFALTIAAIMNDMGAQGWEFQRVDALPSEERQGLTGRATVFHNLLVFRRPLQDAPAQEASVADAPAQEEPREEIVTAEELPAEEPATEPYADTAPAEDAVEYLDDAPTETPTDAPAEPADPPVTRD